MAAGFHCLLFLSLFFLFKGTHCYFVNVDAHATECFFDKVSTGMKMSLTFEVVEGGFLDIDVEVSHVIHHVTTVCHYSQGTYVHVHIILPVATK